MGVTTAAATPRSLLPVVQKFFRPVSASSSFRIAGLNRTSHIYQPLLAKKAAPHGRITAPAASRSGSLIDSEYMLLILIFPKAEDSNHRPVEVNPMRHASGTQLCHFVPARTYVGGF
ncbi:predicted protein [Chaetomium globosum CBS 148.51]|uniref:Uncharacterized protein n=1 Tax=Chaetomium globosum (strain ATCC 6205 / CBS 148.51 / DSM 1962 / NBRC 6347 / NRRL 1970) TaxID=306901 RepID=Q2H6F7_CHAGB|nr:uncharacterized protein CHGG_05758 [Chaetomium globosum CBS 148.51]EAQ89139.1 predicted protein [Chaetomium globosum CBS 148.51]